MDGFNEFVGIAGLPVEVQAVVHGVADVLPGFVFGAAFAGEDGEAGVVHGGVEVGDPGGEEGVVAATDALGEGDVGADGVFTGGVGAFAELGVEIGADVVDFRAVECCGGATGLGGGVAVADEAAERERDDGNGNGEGGEAELEAL